MSTEKGEDSKEGWFVSLLVREEILLAGLYERKILFRLKIYDRLRQATAKRKGLYAHAAMHAWVIAVVTPRARARHRPPRRRCVPSDNPPSPAASNGGIEISGAVKKIASVVALCRY